MIDKQLLNYSIEYLSHLGVKESECLLTTHNMHELISEMGEISILKSNYSNKLDITAIKDNKKGKFTTSNLNKETLNDSLNKVVSLAESSEADDDYSISPKQQSETFSRGVKEPDFEKMFIVMAKLLNDISLKYKTISLKEVSIAFNQYNKKYLNSNMTDFESYRAYYTFVMGFIAKDKTKMTSFNYTYYTFSNLPDDLLEYGNIKNAIEQTTKQLNPTSVSNKFDGDIILTPQCFNSIVYMLVDRGLKGPAIYTKTSRLIDKINKVVASNKFSLHSNPNSADISDGYFITEDGYKAEDLTVIENGVLKSFLLDEYSAKKANMQRSSNIGHCFIVDSGDTKLADMIKNIDKGLFITSLSYGMPAVNGDFSGVAKNSFYIEDGEMKNAVSETMIFANVFEMLLNIEEVSIERVNMGKCIYPWIRIKNVTISGK